MGEQGQAGRGEVGRPGEQLLAIGMRGEAADLVDMGLHRDLLAEDAHAFVALQQPPTKSALRLISDQHHVGFGLPQVVLQSGA